MTPNKHASHPMKWESSPKDVETGKNGKEGSKREELFDRKQVPKLPKQK
jgi:hypothetical protein